MRYSVYKAEDRIDSEKDYERWARDIAEAKGYDLEDFMAYGTVRNFWKETHDRLYHHWLESQHRAPSLSRGCSLFFLSPAAFFRSGRWRGQEAFCG